MVDTKGLNPFSPSGSAGSNPVSGTLKAIDLFCGAGGAGKGLQLAGFDVTGVDIDPQPNYPFAFIQADAFSVDLSKYDFVWASPPCQHYCIGTRTNKHGDPGKYPDLIDKTREFLTKSGKPYIIENVEGAAKWMRSPIRLCGEMFGLRVIRHRLFESNMVLRSPEHKKHRRPVKGTKKDGQPIQRSWYQCVAGHGGNSMSFKAEDWREAMGIDWMSKEELVEAIPPAYSKYLGEQVICML